MGWVWFLVCAASSSGALAQEQPASPAERIAQMREALLYARYDQALSGARTFLEDTTLSAAERNTGLEILAIAQLARRDDRGARETLALLYGRDPDHRLGDRDAGPNVQAAFARARDARPPPITVTIERDVPERLAQRVAPVISVRIAAGADAIHELRLSYRQADGPFERVLMVTTEDGSVARARVPLLDGEDAYDVQWFVEAVAPSGAALGRLGSETDVQHLGVPRADPRQRVRIVRVPGAVTGGPATPPEQPGLLSRWWFWTAIGVVVAAGVVAAIVVTRPTDEPPQGTLPAEEL